MVADVKQRGYAWSVGGSETGISAIAVPISVKKRVVGAINTIFSSKAMSPEEAASRYLKEMLVTQASVQTQLLQEGFPQR